jgi:hypothetical protein
MVKFDQPVDKEKVITGGPWLIFDHCLAVSHWSLEFASPDAKVNRTVVWVRFPGLNLVYYDESFLLAMASAIGRPIKVDTNTLKVERGKFARVCVEVDLTVPVVGKIWVNGHWYKVQYEGLHLICANCGCYGHIGRNCTSAPQQHTTASHGENHQPEQHVMHSMSDSHNGNVLTTLPIILAHNDGKIISNNEGNKDPHGDWLLITRKKKATITPSLNNSKTVTPKANRFSALSIPPQNAKPAPPLHKLPPRPKPADTTRTSKTTYKPKRQRHDDTIIGSPFDPKHNFIGPKNNNNHGTHTHVTQTQDGVSFTHFSATQTQHTEPQNEFSNPTQRKNSTDITMQINTTQQPEPSNKNITNETATSNDNTHIIHTNSDGKEETSAVQDDSREEDMVT